MSEMVFMQDGAKAHTAALTLEWLEDHQVWPNSPDLNPIENLGSILEEEQKCEKKTPHNFATLEKNLSRQLGQESSQKPSQTSRLLVNKFENLYSMFYM